MDKDIKQFLDDLYSVDKSLKKHEKELVEIIKNLIASKPEVSFDQSFKSELRAELLERFEKMQKSGQKNKTNQNIMNKLFYALGGAALVFILLLPNIYQQNKNIPLINKTARLSVFDFGVSQVGDRAFGQLAGNTGNMDTNTMATEEAIGLGGGGGGGAAPMGTKEASMIMPNPITYKYTYDGDISLENDKMLVYKKIKGSDSAKSLAQMIQNANFETIDINSFKNSELRNFSIVEDRDYGYAIYVDLYEGIMSISENWEKWPHPQYQNPLNINQIPEDQKLISIADQFVSDRKLELSQYGQPTIDDQWKVYYENSPERQQFSIPEMISVIYPQLINGQEVYEEYGGKFGIRVGINIRENRASGVWGISTQKYQSSMYEMETDPNKIKKLAEQGGSWPMYYGEEQQIVEVKLGDPELAYSSIWHHGNNQSYQLFVPALVFPVLEQPQEGYHYKQHVVVPLAKEIVNQRINPPDRPDLEPMPLR